MIKVQWFCEIFRFSKDILKKLCVSAVGLGGHSAGVVVDCVDTVYKF